MNIKNKKFDSIEKVNKYIEENNILRKNIINISTYNSVYTNDLGSYNSTYYSLIYWG